MIAMIAMLLVLWMGSSPAASTEIPVLGLPKGPSHTKPEGMVLSSKLRLTLEKGDTLSELFGPDLMKVVKRNRGLISSPHRIGAGIEIRIPPYTYLSARTIERLNRLAQVEEEAVRSLERTGRIQEEALSAGAADSGGEAYPKGAELLGKARKLAEEGNFLAARETAEEAALHLEMSGVIAHQAAFRAQMEEALRRPGPTPRASREALSLAALILFLAVPVVLAARRRSKRSRQREAARRLKWHQDRLKEMERTR